MSISRGVRYALVSVGVLCIVIAVTLVVAPPLIVRHVLIHYLDQTEMTARIGNVDANIFTGTVAIDNAHGQTAAGDGFDIGHAALNLRYAPLLHKRISLTRLALDNARVDVRRTADNALRVGGITMISAKSQHSAPPQWGFGLQHLALGSLAIHYRQAAHGQQPAIDRVLRLDNSSARDAATWQPNNDVPVNANLSMGDNHIQISGRVTPFGKRPSAHFKLVAQGFALDLLAPLTRAAGLKDLAGTLDGRQQIDFDYDPKQALTVTIDGKTRWTQAKLARASGLTIASHQLDWQGKLHAILFKANGKPGRFDTSSSIDAKGLSISQPQSFELKQAAAHWKGNAQTTLSSGTTTVVTEGLLTTTGTHLNAPGRLAFKTDHDSLRGTIQTDLDARLTRINSNGTFKAQHMTFSVPHSLAFGGDRVKWQGNAITRLENRQTLIDTHGKMDLDDLSFTVPDTSHLSAGHVDWNGHAVIHSARLLARRAAGLLAATKVKVDLPGQPIALTADRLAFEGEYGEQPNDTRPALKLTVDGDIDSHRLAVTDTAVHAPWFTALQSHGDKLAIDGLDSIALSGLKSSGVRLLGDTDTDSSVIQAVGLTARRFRLDHLAHYHVADVDISGAVIHTRRDAQGMGVMSEFFGRAAAKGQTGTSTSTTGPHKAGSTYAIDHLSLSGPAVAFADTAVTPNVHIHGSNLKFSIDNLNTAKPNQSASYRLSLDAGAYGHFDSRGNIAPLAPGGVDMNLDAWLRSLAMRPLSGYLNAAMGRRIANGAANGTLHLAATNGELDGTLDVALGNFRLANGEHKKTDIAFGISMDTALDLLRGKSDSVHFKTAILGDVTKPYFSIDNLIREAVLAGLHTALLSDYSPLGLLNNARKALMNLGRSLASRPALFQPGTHYVRPEDRDYLGHLAQVMQRKPELTLTVQGHAVPGDADAMSQSHGASADSGNRVSLQKLARQRAHAVRDYLAARNVNPDRIKLADPVVNSGKNARPEATFSIHGK